MVKRKKRFRKKRFIFVFVIFIGFIFLIIFGINFIFNLRIYNSIKKNNSVKLNSDKFKVWNKTIKYIKDNNKDITFILKDYSIVISSSNIENNMNLLLDINEENGNNKILYINENDLLKNSEKISINLPKILKKYNILDIYGVNDNNDYLIKTIDSAKVINIDVSDYDEYYITNNELEDITCISDIELDSNDELEFDLKIKPSNATIKYEIEDENIIAIKGGNVVAVKKGETVINVLTSEGNSCKINVKVSNNSSNKTKNGFKIELKNGITYIDEIMIVNKTYSLPSSYDPGKLSDAFMDAFYEMQAAARLDGIELFVASGYRSYDYQVSLYNYYVEKDGKELADTYSARPGYSEHQTGLTADINSADESFEGTPEAIWLDENCYKYGFIVRYPKGKDEYTGYEYEPWHLRYVGVELAKKIHDLGGISLEEYFGIESKYED